VLGVGCPDIYAGVGVFGLSSAVLEPA